MAITATVAMSPSTVTAGQKAAATVTISNSGGSSVTVTNLRGNAAPTGQTPRSVAVDIGVCPAGGPNQTVTVAASGSATTTFDVVPMAPATGTYASNPFPSGITPLVPLAMPSQQVLDIGATVVTSDGSSTSATTATLTVNGPTR